ncbi:amino acid ABC transporter substrate-binding protein [Undibacterium jejuense]|uniref:Amino acid ABC transporter substrate-binding protein n=1 Tax=Undibacterium jejuense TaxID=1344949 RepID=A0A923KMD0_9BURK|nr:amino acid ABC transporter substrate-binding protein [Undibacterium jejuense]MBC3860773.1 amino acid ABC transporter substrate-binding protein [Undibacterium jejuense]
MIALSRFLKITLILLVFANPSLVLATTTRVTYPAGEIENDTRFNDVIEILRTALEKTRAKYGDFECGPSSSFVPKKRSVEDLERDDHSVNVIWNPTSEELERKFLVIRIPLRKGLLGYRIPLIRKEDQSKFDQIKTEEDLKKFTVGQGIDWNDIPVYKAHGIEVIQAPYAQLSKMLAGRRFDMFPRGVGELLGEYERYHEIYPEIAIEKNLAFYYQFPVYFFFNLKDQQLKERIETGLQIMRKDGSFDSIFNKYNMNAIEKLNLKGRRLIRLSNPVLPKNTPLNDASLWYSPPKQ